MVDVNEVKDKVAADLDKAKASVSKQVSEGVANFKDDMKNSKRGKWPYFVFLGLGGVVALVVLLGILGVL